MPELAESGGGKGERDLPSNVKIKRKRRRRRRRRERRRKRRRRGAEEEGAEEEGNKITRKDLPRWEEWKGMER